MNRTDGVIEGFQTEGKDSEREDLGIATRFLGTPPVQTKSVALLTLPIENFLFLFVLRLS